MRRAISFPHIVLCARLLPDNCPSRGHRQSRLVFSSPPRPVDGQRQLLIFWVTLSPGESCYPRPFNDFTTVTKRRGLSGGQTSQETASGARPSAIYRTDLFMVTY
ncbi:hypothetical protein RRG08_062358 [Elysia crispata]|uniref:Uncharacterized protein n=1 Tax=Elysia crispata TaxID=231223 RepID=A0AAE1CYU6_9GAST|nr:hypothetical protein RRG08_062358 [Elysia crispata]